MRSMLRVLVSRRRVASRWSWSPPSRPVRLIAVVGAGGNYSRTHSQVESLSVWARRKPHTLQTDRQTQLAVTQHHCSSVVARRQSSGLRFSSSPNTLRCRQPEDGDKQEAQLPQRDSARTSFSARSMIVHFTEHRTCCTTIQNGHTSQDI